MKTHNFKIVNMDTDSISFCKQDGLPFTEKEQIELIKDLNSYYPENIKWEHDGIYEKIIILKAKNYILLQNGKVTKKGSSLKSSKTEPRIKDFMSEIIDCLLHTKTEEIIHIYHKYCHEIFHLTDISGYCSKKTITESVLNPSRTNEQKILDSLKGKQVQQGDKIYVYFDTSKQLKLKEDWNNDHSTEKLLERLYKTLLIFKNVINIEQYPKYHLKNKKVKEQLYNIVFHTALEEIINE